MAATLGVNAYTDLTSFKAWASERGYELFDYLDNQIEHAIVISTVDFLDANYMYRGQKVSEEQELKLPTDKVAISDISRAANQAAYQQLKGELFIDPSEVELKGQIASQKSKLGDLEEETSYHKATARLYTYPTNKIDALLKPYTIQTSRGFLVG